ncbi:MAG: hypothetical protein ACQESJ_08405 [Bacteroidota bacterium]
MGTELKKKEEIREEINKIQNDIKEVLGKIGWKIPRFAERVFYEKFNTDVEEEIKRFIEKFKKDIHRNSSTHLKLREIKEYQRILYDLDEVRKTDLILPRNLFKDKFSDEFNQKMKEVSKLIDDSLKKNYEV